MSITYPSTKHSSSLPDWGYNEMLFTHVGVDLKLNSSLFLDLAATNNSVYKNCRVVTVNYNYNIQRSIIFRYLPATGYLKLRNPVRLSSKAKLRSSLTIRRYEVGFEQTEDPQQVRRTYYQGPVSYTLSPRSVANDATYSIANNGDLVSTLLLLNPSEQVFRLGSRHVEGNVVQESTQRVISHLPLSKGYIYEVSEVLQDALQIESFSNQKVSACKILLPSLLDGHIPSSRLGYDMGAKSPLDIAWSLIYACTSDRPIFVLGALKGLVFEAKQREIIIWDALSESYVVNPQAAWGFESNFIPGSTSTDTNRDIADNALLGWALCKAVKYLQQRLPLHDWSLQGSYTEFKELLTQLLLSQGYLCAYAVSREAWWACSRAEGLAYNYAVLSRRASYLTSVFLDELLQIKYDYFIHQQAARLHISITNSLDIDDDSTYFADYDDSQDEIAPYKGLWLWSRQLLQQAYESFLCYTATASVETDSLAAYSLFTLHSLAQVEDDKPTWVDDYIEEFSVPARGEAPAAVQVRALTPVYLALKDINIIEPDLFELRAEEAYAQVCFTLVELRRLWPVGCKWGSTEVINSVNSVLGSILEADANLYFDYFLIKGLITNARSLGKSQAQYIRDWVKDLLQVRVDDLLVGDKFLQDLLVGFIGRDPNDRESIRELLTDVLGYLDATVTNPQPKPYSLLKDVYRADDLFTDYLPEVQELGEVDYFNRQSSHSIVYKPAQEQLISEDITRTSFTDRITSYGGVLLRRQAGFPYRNVLVSAAYPNASSDVPINQEYSDTPTIRRLMYAPWADISDGDLNASYEEWVNDDLYVKDGSALIKPLPEYIPRLIIHLGRTASRYLGQFLLSTITAGVKLQVRGLNEYVYKGKVIRVFRASRRYWTISNRDFLDNTSFDNLPGHLYPPFWRLDNDFRLNNEEYDDDSA